MSDPKPLIPADPQRCQAEQKIYQPFVMGGSVRRTERCTALPVFIAVELKPGADGRRGSMSLCLKCAKVMLDDADLRQRVQLQPVERKAS